MSATPTSHVCKYDLHSHTYWSYDGLARPEAYFEHARKVGVKYFALTEHHNVDSMGDLMEAGRGYPEITAIPAAEMTVRTSLGSIDLLCYGLPVEGRTDGLPADVLAGWERVRQNHIQWQRNYATATWKGLQAIGVDYTEQQLIDLLATYRPAKTTQRQGHVRVKNPVQWEYFIKRGFIQSKEEYSPLVARGMAAIGGAPAHPHVSESVPAMKKAGALIVIAHPFKGYFKGMDRGRMDQLREECMLDGIECAHHSIPEEAGAFFRQYCVEHGLVSTGGWDSHDEAQMELGFGRHGGDDRWLDEFLERLPKHGARL